MRDPLKSDSGAYSVLRLADSCESNPFKFDILVVPAFDNPVVDFADRVLTESPLPCFVGFSTVWEKAAWRSLSVYAVFAPGGFGILSFSCRN